MCHIPVVPFLSKSTLFVAGMTGKCPALRAVVAYAARDERVAPERRNLILEKLFRALPVLPAAGDVELGAFASMTDDAVAAIERRQKGPGADALRAVWNGVIEAIDEETERGLAQRCGVLLTELFRRRVTASRIRMSATR